MSRLFYFPICFPTFHTYSEWLTRTKFRQIFFWSKLDLSSIITALASFDWKVDPSVIAIFDKSSSYILERKKKFSTTELIFFFLSKRGNIFSYFRKNIREEVYFVHILCSYVDISFYAEFVSFFVCFPFYYLVKFTIGKN